MMPRCEWRGRVEVADFLRNARQFRNRAWDDQHPTLEDIALVKTLSGREADGGLPCAVGGGAAAPIRDNAAGGQRNRGCVSAGGGEVVHMIAQRLRQQGGMRINESIATSRTDVRLPCPGGVDAQLQRVFCLGIAEVFRFVDTSQPLLHQHAKRFRFSFGDGKRYLTSSSYGKDDAHGRIY